MHPAIELVHLLERPRPTPFEASVVTADENLAVAHRAADKDNLRAADREGKHQRQEHRQQEEPNNCGNKFLCFHNNLLFIRARHRLGYIAEPAGFLVFNPNAVVGI